MLPQPNTHRPLTRLPHATPVSAITCALAILLGAGCTAPTSAGPADAGAQRASHPTESTNTDGGPRERVSPDGSAGQPDAGSAQLATGTATELDDPPDAAVDADKDPGAFVACNGATGDEAPTFTEQGMLKQVGLIVGSQDFEWNAVQSVSMRMSPDGRHVYLFSHADYVLAILARDADSGVLSHVASFHKDSELGAHIPAPSAGVFIDGGRRLVIPDFLSATLQVFARDVDSGALQHERQIAIASPGNRWPRKPVYSPALDAIVGSLTTRGGGLFWLDAEIDNYRVPTVVLGENLGIPEFDPDSNFAVSRDGRDYYALTTDPVATVRQLRLDPAARSVAHVSTVADGVDGAIMSGWPNIAVGPQDSHLYTTTINTAVFGHYLRDCETGRLKLLGHYGQSGMPCGNHDYPVVSDDGLNLYVSAHTPSLGSVLAVYARDPFGGALQLLQLIPVPTADEVGIEAELIMSPDQRHVYAARGWRGVHIFTFERSP